jgi:hypothetical protein
MESKEVKMKIKKNRKISLSIVLLLVTVLFSACSTMPVVEVKPETTLPRTEVPTKTLEKEQPIENTPTTIPIESTSTLQPTITDTPSTENQISFSNDVFPIVQNRCINCHGGDRIEEGLDMTSYAGIMAGSINGTIVIPGDAENSLFVELVASQKMPKRGAKLTPAMVKLFEDWVNQGALDN